MKKRIAVILLLSSLFASGCNAKEPVVTDLEPTEGEVISLDSSPGVNQGSLSGESSDSELGQLSTPESSGSSSSEIYISLLLDGGGNLSVVSPNSTNHLLYELTPEKAKEFLEGIDFSRLEPISEEEAWERNKNAGEPVRIRNHGFTCMLYIYRGSGVVKLYTCERHELGYKIQDSEETRYYSTDEEFYSSVHEMVMEFKQYNVWHVPYPNGANPFQMDPLGPYSLYAYNAQLLGYTYLGYAYWATQEALQPELEVAVAAINSLPTLETVDVIPDGDAEYGLMAHGIEFFLYKNCLVVDGTSYVISDRQYDSLKNAMTPPNNSTWPQWFLTKVDYVVSISCTDTYGTMQDLSEESIRLAVYEMDISVKSAKTYEPGSKNLNNSPFKAVYTLNNGVTLTVYVSDDRQKASDVTIYIEASDEEYACEYAIVGDAYSYTESLRQLLA